MARLPIEVIETIIDFLQNDREALKQCCLASKSLIARTRSHLFKHVYFREPSKLRAWEGCFPDLDNTPAIFTTHLEICDKSLAGKDIPSWIRSTFINVVVLGVDVRVRASNTQGVFAPFHNLLPPHVKSLAVGWRGRSIKSQEVFHFICSFPSLEDLDVSRGMGLFGTAGGFLPLPKLTGTISLTSLQGELIRQFLELSGDLHFREIVFSLVYIRGSLEELVERCSGTLECIVIRTLGDVPIDKINFSNATELKEVKFEIDTLCQFQGFAEVLDTITRERNKYFEKVSLRLLSKVDLLMVKENLAVLGEAGLERALVGLMERCENRLKFALEVYSGEKRWADGEMKEIFQEMFPEVMKRGIAFETLQGEPFYND